MHIHILLSCCFFACSVAAILCAARYTYHLVTILKMPFPNKHNAKCEAMKAEKWPKILCIYTQKQLKNVVKFPNRMNSSVHIAKDLCFSFFYAYIVIFVRNMCVSTAYGRKTHYYFYCCSETFRSLSFVWLNRNLLKLNRNQTDIPFRAHIHIQYVHSLDGISI